MDKMLLFYQQQNSLSKDELREGDEISEVFTPSAKRKSYMLFPQSRSHSFLPYAIIYTVNCKCYVKYLLSKNENHKSLFCGHGALYLGKQVYSDSRGALSDIKASS